VETVSASLYEQGDAVTIKAVLEFPPRDSVRILVSFESLYGICFAFLEVSALITLARAERLPLIFLASSSY